MSRLTRAWLQVERDWYAIRVIKIATNTKATGFEKPNMIKCVINLIRWKKTQTIFYVIGKNSQQKKNDLWKDVV